MPETLNIPVEKKSFDFVDTIRCISMMGIVFEHTMIVLKYTSPWDTLIGIAFFQIFKFVTVAFFIIGGFLINYKFQEYTPGQYLKNRLNNTIWPWIFWIIILILLNSANLLFRHIKFGNPAELPAIGPYLLDQVFHNVFLTSFWFIPNFLLCISILLIFKRYLKKLWFGIFWLIVSLVYSLNIYHNWFIAGHTTALFGFVCYLWLGVYMNQHYAKISTFVLRVSYAKLIMINLILFALCVGESLYLSSIGSPELYNTLRITNIFYSLGMFVLLLKIGKVGLLTKYLKPRETTFGIYLLHSIIIIHLLAEIMRPFHVEIENLNVWQAIGMSVIRFLLTYVVSFLITKAILKTKFKWLVGAKS